MRPLDRLRALEAAFAHRVRAALTLIGLVIGSGSIVLLASLLEGGQDYLVHQNQDVADEDVIEVDRDEPPPSQKDRTTRPLSRADAAAMRASPLLEGALVAPEASLDTYARYQGRKKRVAMVSSGSATMSLYRLTVEKGRALDDEDRRSGSRACVIGHEIWDELVRGRNLDGLLRLEIDNHLFTVVGVLAHKPMIGSTDSTYLWDRKVMIPETTYDALYAGAHEVDRLYVRKSERHAAARAAVTGVLSRRHFGVENFALAKDQSGGMEALILNVIRVLLLGTGALAVVTSGINIMNVMLVTVSERTREIGLRRAVGETPTSILVQFLLEAAVLSLAGGLVGVLGGIAVAWVAAVAARAAIGHWNSAIVPWSLALGLGLAVMTGLFFGIVPAWRAARVSPIDALRTE